MRTHTRVAVIGGGVVGCSVLYHLTKLGWSDVTLLERSELTSGSTWHAAGGFHTLNGDTNMSALQGYTIRLYRELEAITGLSCGLHHVGGVTLASDADRLDLLRAERAKHKHMGLDTRMVTPEEIGELSPITNLDGILGGLYDPLDGHLDPSGTTHAYARAAADGGGRDRHPLHGARDQPAPRRQLGRGDRPGHDPRRARRQRGRALGARGRGDGGDLPAAAPDGAPVPRHRGRPRGRGDGPRAPPHRRSRGRVLPAPGGPGPVHRLLRAALRALGGGRHAVGFRPRALARQARQGGGLDRVRLQAVPSAGARRRQARHQRPLHLRARRQPLGRPRAGPQELLVGLRRDGGLQPGRRRGPQPRAVDDRGRGRAQRHGHGRGALRALDLAGLHAAQGGRELPPPLQGHLPQRGAARRPPLPHHADARHLHRHGRRLGPAVRPGGAQLLRPRERASARDALVPPLGRLRGGGARGPRRARGGGHQRGPQLLEVRRDGAGRPRLARPDHGRAHPPGRGGSR